jgi:uncharacterized protein YidB (DUF937 family)
MFGRGAGRSRGGVSPLTLALLGTLAYRTLKGKGRLADILGKSAEPQPPSQTPGRETSASGLNLNDLLSPGALSTGLEGLLNRFRQNGHATEAESWVTTGSNKEIGPSELEEALGEERIAWLMEQTDLSREELLAGLSKSLPEAVDKLTPDGRIPTEAEARRLM